MDPWVRYHGMKAYPTLPHCKSECFLINGYQDMDYILHSGNVLDSDLWPNPLAWTLNVRCHGMKANPTGYQWSKYECLLVSGSQDIDF